MNSLRNIAALLALFAGTNACAADDTYIYVLGVAQDAGYPQAGCYQPHCMPAWEDKELRRTTSSIAVVGESCQCKFLFDATPDIRDQLYRLHQVAPDDDYALNGVFLTHAHIGHYTGLMHFGHEAMGAKDISVYAMPRMHEFLSTNGPWDQLVRYNNIRLYALQNNVTVHAEKQLRVTPFLVPHRDEYSETVGYRIDGPNKSAIFIPDIDKWERWDTDIRDVIRSADYALLDATFFANGEIPGRDMSDIPHPFVAESMALFEDMSDDEKARVIFIHMNHTNPLLQENSDAQRLVRAQGFKIAYEGTRLEL